MALLRISCNAAVSACEKQGWGGRFNVNVMTVMTVMYSSMSPLVHIYRSMVAGYANVRCNAAGRLAG